MSIFIFIVVIVALIVVHEFGHFVAAKLSGMRVDEFGLGYPPRAATIATKNGTAYTLNWLPFGGFVKIYGEDGTTSGERDSRAFSNQSRIRQAIVLVAGIAMNLLFAYVLIASSLALGTPRALSDDEIANATDVELAVANVLPGSPAASAGLVPGDSIMSAKGAAGEWRAADPKSFSAFIAGTGGNSVTLTVKRGGEEKLLTAVPEAGLIGSDPSRYALGVEVGTIGVAPLPLFSALTEGAVLTWGAITLTATGLAHFLFSIFTLSANFAQVAGPVGIAGVVGAASSQGLGNLLSIVAIISINLALINLVPIPALDGGRLLFVIIESIIRRPIKPSVVQAVNGAGFALLLFLMAVVTIHDIFRMVG